MPVHMTHSMNGEMERCINNCMECHRVCLETEMYCAKMGGKHAEPMHLKLLHDCAQICMTSADFMIRDSDFHPRTCGVCADICERCAESCERFGNDALMQACAEVCRRCAQSCREMASMPVHA